MEENNSNPLKGKIIYHYCSPESFLKIIESKCIWLSAINNMNDYSEGNWYSKALDKVLDNKKNDFGDNNCLDVSNEFKAKNTIKYISCFSKLKDSLSQWRAYAQDGEGVAIGLSVDKIGIPFYRPNLAGIFSDLPVYLSEMRYAGLDKLVEIIDTNLSKLINEFNANIRSILFFNQFSNIVKNPAFKEEEEVRLVYAPDISKDEPVKVINPSPGLDQLKYRIASGFLTSYFEYPIKNNVFKEVVLGPKNKFTDEDIATFLRLHGLGDVTITRSSATYR